MQYLERTLQVRSALLGQADLLTNIRSIFTDHLVKGGVHQPVGTGTSRWAYNVGACEVAPGININLILKLKVDPVRMKYSQAARRSMFSDWSEFGAFEMYYDFVADHISTISFRTASGYRAIVSEFDSAIKQSFALSDRWGGTQVDQGDLGAIPYFQIAVRYKQWYGHLTEGEPPFIQPLGTAKHWNSCDDSTVEKDRIIDLGPTQCRLIEIDRGGYMSLTKRYPNNLGVRLRGGKYFQKKHRLDL